eukprot:TRINITY_DN4383_c0_g1_i25.p1 TRINITY_DN4383_c0_g1~~TRINITY_DN4383_c0_g1_i25.p1  ORF type:complete len:219 (-),score=35.41 TRINITY_DN4383_c0_g1_i25:1142-1798(-)
MYIAKTIGRTLALPAFNLHAVGGPEDLRPFERTFSKTFVDKYVPSVSLSEYHDLCGGVVDTLVWMRDDQTWYHLVEFWMEYTDMKYNFEITSKSDILFMNKEEILKFFQRVENMRCIALCFPFRNVAEDDERKKLALNLVHSNEIVDYASAARQEMEVEWSELMSIHWRWGEDSCGWYLSPDPHLDYDFCWGTTCIFCSPPVLVDALSIVINFYNSRN